MADNHKERQKLKEKVDEQVALATGDPGLVITGNGKEINRRFLLSSCRWSRFKRCCLSIYKGYVGVRRT